MKKAFYLLICFMFLATYCQAQLQSNDFRVAVFPLTFTDVPQEYRDQFPTKTELDSIIFDSSSHIQNYLDVISYDALNFTGDVFDYTTASYLPWSVGNSIKGIDEIVLLIVVAGTKVPFKLISSLF